MPLWVKCYLFVKIDIVCKNKYLLNISCACSYFFEYTLFSDSMMLDSGGAEAAGNMA